MLSNIPLTWKRHVATIVRLPLLRQLMLVTLRLLIPRQRIGVSIVALDEQERVLLLYHVFHPHVPWGLPGGWLNTDESPPDGALRELKEETGLTAVLGPVVHISREPNPSHIGIAFLAHIQPGSMKLSSEIMKAQWFPIDALPTPIFPFIREAVQAAATMHRLSKSQKPIQKQNYTN